MTGCRLPEGVEWVGPWRLVKDRTVSKPQWRRFVNKLITGEQAGLGPGYSNVMVVFLPAALEEGDGSDG